jgi:hypothetical protein
MGGVFLVRNVRTGRIFPTAAVESAQNPPPNPAPSKAAPSFPQAMAFVSRVEAENVNKIQYIVVYC